MSNEYERERDEADENLPDRRGRERLAAPVKRSGMFGTGDTGDTSGFGGLQVRGRTLAASRRPFSTPDDPRTADFDRVADDLEAGLGDMAGAVERVEVARGEITFHVRREALLEIARVLRDDPALRYELCTGVVGVHFPEQEGRELHAIYHFRSITHNSEIRVATTCPDSDPHVPRSCRSTRPTTGTNGRPGTSSESSSTAPRAHTHPDARRLARPPPAQGLPAGWHPRGIPRCDRAHAGRTEVLPVTRRTTVTEFGQKGGTA